VTVAVVATDTADVDAENIPLPKPTGTAAVAGTVTAFDVEAS